MKSYCLLAVILWGLSVGCKEEGTSIQLDANGLGGRISTGGVAVVDGSLGSGGIVMMGGRIGTGGTLAVGGQIVSGSGGSVVTGGTFVTGGTVSMGGKTAMPDASQMAGGTLATGGAGGGSGGHPKFLDGGNEPDTSGAMFDAPGYTDATGKEDTSKEVVDCFANLRPLVGKYQLSTKTNTSDNIRVRLAMEVDPKMFGTSGTVVWKLIRFGIEHDEKSVCVVDENQLKTAYKTSRHNCSDVATITVGDVTYTLSSPDREVTKLSVNGVETSLKNLTCRSNTVTCSSGGPC